MDWSAPPIGTFLGLRGGVAGPTKTAATTGACICALPMMPAAVIIAIVRVDEHSHQVAFADGPTAHRAGSLVPQPLMDMGLAVDVPTPRDHRDGGVLEAYLAAHFYLLIYAALGVYATVCGEGVPRLSSAGRERDD